VAQRRGTAISTVYGTAKMIHQARGMSAMCLQPLQQQQHTLRVVVKIAAGTSETHYVDKIAFHAGDNQFGLAVDLAHSHSLLSARMIREQHLHSDS
jgi:hypothetical protein